jgi:hypothetical protein
MGLASPVSCHSDLLLRMELQCILHMTPQVLAAGIQLMNCAPQEHFCKDLICHRGAYTSMPAAATPAHVIKITKDS